MPQELLAFPPSYVVVGVYRLINDPNLRNPIWAKTKHGVIRGVLVAAIWGTATYKIQRAFVGYFLLNTPRFANISPHSVFGFKTPVATFATFLFMSAQLTLILRFFLAKNLRIARARAWELTLKSRGKDDDFWGPYTEEWEEPPSVEVGGLRWQRWVGGTLGKYIVKSVLLAPLSIYPIVGILITAVFKAVDMSRNLHAPYFASKKMTPVQVATFMEEHKWQYRSFGFAAALLESIPFIPFISLFFSVSNRIGACMWAFDLEKRQRGFREGELKPLKKEEIGFKSAEEELARIVHHPKESSGSIAGSWEDVRAE